MNPKKHKEYRRKRPSKSVATHKIVYLPEKHFSQAGVEYTHYKQHKQTL